MGGINIYAGSFQGSDKSGSAFEAVLDDVAGRCSVEVLSAIQDIRASLEEASDHVLIDTDSARILISPLRDYCRYIRDQMEAAEPFDQIELEEAAAGRPLQPNEGLGWKCYCAQDLLAACETATAEGEPVALVW